MKFLTQTCLLALATATLPLAADAAGSMLGNGFVTNVYKESVYSYKTDIGQSFTVREYEPLGTSGSAYMKVTLPNGTEYILHDVTEAGDHKYQNKDNTIAWCPKDGAGTLIDLEREREIGSGILFKAKLVNSPVEI